jgi:ribulose-phosphate 3-epimerase
MASIVPSLLAGDFARLGEYLDAVEALGVSSIHIDVVDGHFRPGISVGQPVVRSICKATRLKVDVHLLVERPERYIEDFVKAGAGSLAFHLEATQNITLAAALARRLGIKVGLALDAATPVSACLEVLEDFDFVLLGVRAGAKLSRSLHRVAALAKEREAGGLSFAVAVEGDIGVGEARKLFPAGADILVVNSTIFDKKAAGGPLGALMQTLADNSTASGREMEPRVR